MTPNKISLYTIIAAILLAVTLGTVIAVQESQLEKARAEASRLALNQEALLRDLDTARAENGHLMASVDALTLRRDELEGLLPKYAAEVANLRLKLKDVQGVASVETSTAVQVVAVHDTVFVQQEAPKAAGRRYRFRDAWVNAAVDIVGDSAHLELTARDSLTVVAHREPRKCLFRRKGKVTRYTVSPASPYTKIDGVSFVEVVDK